jgi:hypothetical protein
MVEQTNNLCRTVYCAREALRSSDANLQFIRFRFVINRRIRMKPFMFCNDIKVCDDANSATGC